MDTPKTSSLHRYDARVLEKGEVSLGRSSGRSSKRKSLYQSKPRLDQILESHQKDEIDLQQRGCQRTSEDGGVQRPQCVGDLIALAVETQQLPNDLVGD